LKKWQARIDGIYLGTFGTELEAAQAYNDGVDKYWGGNGWKNPISQIPVLVKCTMSNAKRHQSPKGRFKGIRSSGNKWRAMVACHDLGTFPTPEQAAIAYNDAVDKYWGGDGYKNRVQNVPVSVERRLTSVKSVVDL